MSSLAQISYAYGIILICATEGRILWSLSVQRCSYFLIFLVEIHNMTCCIYSLFLVQGTQTVRASISKHRFHTPAHLSAVLLWLLTAACIKTGRPQIARRAIDLAERRLLKDGWPEYYDGKLGRYVGKQARKFQTWSIAGYLVAKMMLEDPSHLGMISLEEDRAMLKPVLKRSASWTN
jgi:hypothetical protein